MRTLFWTDDLEQELHISPEYLRSFPSGARGRMGEGYLNTGQKVIWRKPHFGADIVSGGGSLYRLWL
jgi:hypothetical protein